MNERVLFVTVSRGGTARNILKTDVLRVLRASGLRLVVLTPAWNDPRFLAEFSAPGVTFAPLSEPRWSWLDGLLVGLHKALVYNASTEMRDRYGIYDPKEANTARYWAKRIVFRPLRTIGWLKEAARALDAALVRDRTYGDLFARYDPVAVFCTSIMEDMDVSVAKQARQRGVPIIGMPKSWDNLSKMSVRVKPDRMAVWAPYSREEARTFQNMRDADVVETGIPQFDAYRDERLVVPRAEFLRGLGLDPAKKVIVYASEGKIAKHDPDIVDMLLKGIRSGGFGAPAQLFIRPHFIYKGDAQKFSRFASDPDVRIDATYAPSAGFRDQWDYSDAQIRHMANLLRHCDLLITSNSTLTLDAAAFDKPVINVAFDGYARKPFGDSIAKWYTTEYYRRVVASGAPWMVRSEQGLHEAVAAFLADPSLRARERASLVRFFCGTVDGKSGERLGRAVAAFALGRYPASV
ncbi:hypothetical protein EPO33_02635 [Patescibacteria group bacterium]|nr:MAG: hypothetical protein EPO33_02635 [Patescibacteria group bacterium]